MKIWILVFAFALLIPGMAAAHPPSDIKLEYDSGKQMLSVSMAHVSRDLSEHRIRRIVVLVNGAEYEAHTFATQPSKSVQEAELAVKAAAGDTIAIKAYCSKGGIGEAEVIVP